MKRYTSKMDRELKRREKDAGRQWELKASGPPIRHLRCWNEYWQGRAIYKRLGAIWSCIEADECMRFLVGMSHEKAKNELLRRGCHWEWH